MRKRITIPCNSEKPYTTLEYNQTSTKIEIEILTTEDEQRRKGYASEAVKKVQKLAITLHIPVFARVDDTKKWILELYTKLGFTEKERHQITLGANSIGLEWYPQKNQKETE
jgi:hypothetical protein